MQTQAILKLLEKELVNLPDIDVVWLYGSRAKATEHSLSDIDLAIAFNNFSLSQQKKIDRINSVEILLNDETLTTQQHVSCVDINMVPTYLAFNVINEGKVFYSQNKQRIWQEEARVLGKFEFQNMEVKYG
jgi:predicted nucleotidyltransferase